jgi:NAD-dependent SIR2 family protein deacetylase
LLVIFLIKKRKKKQVARIKCKKCGEVYSIKNQSEWGEKDINYKCSKCNSDIKIAFFGYCDDCEEFVGFRKYTLGNRLLKGAKKALKVAIEGVDAYIDPISGIMTGIKHLTKIVDNTPSASAAGTCSFCDNVYLECPQCGYTVKFPVSVEQSDTIVNCSNCHTNMKHP